MAHELHYGSGRGSVHMHGVSHCDVHGQTVRAQQPIIQELAERNKINMNLILTKRFFLITEFQFSKFFFSFILFSIPKLVRCLVYVCTNACYQLLALKTMHVLIDK